jgi:hypothetical protein
VTALSDSVIRGIGIAKWKTLSAIVLSMGVVASTLGAIGVSRRGPGESQLVAQSAETLDISDAAEDSPNRNEDQPKTTRQPEMPEGFITSPGEYRLYNGKLLIKVWEEKGRIRWHAVFPGKPGDGNTTLGSGIAGIGKSSAWFVFPASADVVWSYEPEAKRIYLVKRTTPDDFVVKHADLPADWSAVLKLETLPDRVLKRLPAELRPTSERKD